MPLCCTTTTTTVNVDIFAQLNFHASSIRRYIRAYLLRAFTTSFYLCHYDNNFHSHQISAHLRALREIFENMYCAKMSTFTVGLLEIKKV